MEPEQAVAVIACGGKAPISLRELCAKHGWLCVVAEQATQALRIIRVRHILVVIVQVGASNAASMEMLDLLSTEARDVSLIAVALKHDETTERNARAAGAHWYVSNVTATGTIEDIVISIIERQGEPIKTQASRRIPRVQPIPSRYEFSARPCPERMGRHALGPRTGGRRLAADE